MSTAHRILSDMFRADPALDPGNAGTITVERSPERIALASAAAETRTLARPTVIGAILTLFMQTDGGDITLTVTGGYNEDGDTTFTFSDPGQFLMLVSCYDGTNFFWRKFADYQTGNVTPTEAGFLSGVTAGTWAASKAMTLDANGDATAVDGTDIALGSTTGTKIGTATTQKLGFYNATPVTQPTAYTQTYATADKTHANATAATLTVTDGAGTNDGTIAAITTGGAAADQSAVIAAIQELADQINKLVADQLDTKQLVNAVIDDLQALGLVG